LFGDIDAFLYAGVRLVQRDLEVVTKIVSTSGPRSRPIAHAEAAEQALKQVIETAKDVSEVGESLTREIEPAWPTGTDTGMAELVVHSSFLFVGQDLVSLGGLFEFLLRVFVTRVAVRVVFKG
jgi:hypothetical protein